MEGNKFNNKKYDYYLDFIQFPIRFGPNHFLCNLYRNELHLRKAINSELLSPSVETTQNDWNKH